MDNQESGALVNAPASGTGEYIVSAQLFAGTGSLAFVVSRDSRPHR